MRLPSPCALRAAFRRNVSRRCLDRRTISSNTQNLSSTETDSLGIPLRPTWSVNDLLSSYPKPSIDHTILEQLHKLAALKLPDHGSEEYHKIKRDLEEMVRLVEAVKLVDTDGVELAEAVVSGHPEDVEETREQDPHGRDLLKFAKRTREGYYVVDTDARQ
ncbi:hypothetical protein ONZ45_g520 [Pleurotus djamor]|nr:hypothetical protein ONZ45_g520 [Pleurotus djamor]